MNTQCVVCRSIVRKDAYLHLLGERGGGEEREKEIKGGGREREGEGWNYISVPP